MVERHVKDKAMFLAREVGVLFKSVIS